MSEKAPNTVITAIIIIIVLFTIALIILNSDTRDSIVRIAGEVFHSEEAEKQDATTNTMNSQINLISNLQDCDNSGKYNLESNDQCFCFSIGLGIIKEGNYLIIQNKDNKLITTAMDENGAPLAQSENYYNLGLMVADKNSNELSCIFPEEFYIKGVDEGSSLAIPFISSGSEDVNNLYVFWNDERANKNPFAEGDDYTFKIYREGNEEDYPSLASAPVFYRIDQSHYCLVTDLLEHSLSYNTFYLTSSDDTMSVITDSEMIQRIAEQPTQVNLAIDEISQTEKFETLVIPFLLDNSRYCNKL